MHLCEGRGVRLRVGKLDESGSDTILNQIVELLIISQLVESNRWIKYLGQHINTISEFKKLFQRNLT